MDFRLGDKMKNCGPKVHSSASSSPFSPGYCAALASLHLFSVLLFLLLFTLHLLIIGTSPPPPARASITQTALPIPELRPQTQACKAVGPGAHHFSTTKVTTKILAYGFTVPFFFFHTCASLESHNHPCLQERQNFIVPISGRKKLKLTP